MLFRILKGIDYLNTVFYLLKVWTFHFNISGSQEEI